MAPKGAKARIAAIEPGATLSHEKKHKPHLTVEQPNSPDDEGNGQTVETIEVEVVEKHSGGLGPEIMEKPKNCGPMTPKELEELHACETILEKNFQAFIEVGHSLAIIQAQGLYREKAPTFKDYLAKYWDFTPQRAWQLIGASDFATTLKARIDPTKLPSTERAFRELMRAPDDKVVEVLEEALREGEPTAERINAARLKIIPPKVKDGKTKRMPPVKIEAALKAGATWARFLKEFKSEQFDTEQHKQVTGLQKEAATAFSKLGLSL